MQRVILKGDCPVAGLNQLFPNGVPVMSVEPTIEVNQMPCLEFPLAVGGYTMRQEVLERVVAIIKGDKCPIALMLTASTSQVVPLDPEWVEKVVPN